MRFGIIDILSKGAQINSTHVMNATALYIAARAGHLSTVNLLLSVAGIDINAAIENVATALYTSVHNGHSEITEVLLKAGANTEIIVDGQMLLNAGIQKGRVKDVELLLKYGIKIISDNLYTPLAAALMQQELSEKHNEIYRS